MKLEADIEEAHRLHCDLAELELQMRRLPWFDPRLSMVQRRYCELLLRSARLKQAAIGWAIAIFKIDARRVRSRVRYASRRDREGATYVDSYGIVRVEIGDDAFGSAGRLGSRIAHEVEVHVNRHIAQGTYRPPTDERGTLLQELEAHDYELASKDRFGLSAEELELLAQRRESYYRRLGL